MKVLMIETGGWGGIAHYAYNLSQALNKRVKRIVLATNVDYELENFKRDFYLYKVFEERDPYPKLVYNLMRVYYREKPDILHFHSAFKSTRDWLLFSIFRLFHLPIIYTVHNVFPHGKRAKSTRWTRFILGCIYRSCRHLFVHSNEGKEELEGIFGIPDEKVSVIPHGNYLFILPPEGDIRQKSCEEQKIEAREKLGLRNDDMVVLCFGTIREYKGIEFLIPAFAKAKKKIPKAKLVIAGLPRHVDIKIYQDLIDGYDLEKEIILIPTYISLKDTPSYFIASDACVFPYIYIYGSGSLQFAYAFSRPVVTTNVGSFPRMVKDGENGYIVPPRDIDSLANALIKVLANKVNMERMGRSSKDLAQTRFSWDKIANDTIRSYELTKR